MGSIIGKFTNNWKEFRAAPAYVTMLGLDAAGKTTILHKLKCGETKRTIPTVGVSVLTVKPCKGLTMTVWDVGGQSVLRPLWQHYMKDTDGLIFVVDSSDEQRFEDARDELFKILSHTEDEPEFPILILANKNDLACSQPASKIEDALTLYKLSSKQQFHVGSCCATSGEGLMEGLRWFAEMIREFRRLHDRSDL